MNKTRIEAFSDDVLAIIITIMVLEIKAPEEDSFESLKHLIPVFLSYILSFIYVGIYWNNHHHMFQVVKKVNGSILWGNLFLLFWLSLIPFATSWIGEHHFAAVPMSIYGFVSEKEIIKLILYYYATMPICYLVTVPSFQKMKIL